MRYTIITLFCLLLCSIEGLAQKEASHWYFGPRLGLHFLQGDPQLLRNSAMTSGRGCVSISDKVTGQLLFYGNGRTLFNRFHQPMPSSGLFADTCGNAIIQSVLAVPVPDEPTQYYIFSLFIVNQGRLDSAANCESGDFIDFFVQDTANYFQLRYSVIDMHLDGGRGDLMPGEVNLFLQNNLATKLTAIPHANQKDYWLITHGWNSQSFYVYPISETGIGLPIKQAIGSIHQWYTQGNARYSEEINGELKPSPDGTKLASAVYNLKPRPFDVFDFDAATGSISNYQNYGNIAQQTGVTFSPDNSKLYVTSANKVDQSNFWEIIRQYDLSLPTLEQRTASGKSIIRFNPVTNIREGRYYPVNSVFSTLHIAPNGKIYGVGNGSSDSDIGGNNDVLVISQPNRLGFECDVTMQRLGFGLPDDRFGFRSFPNYIQSYFNHIPSRQTGECDFSGLVLYPNPAHEEVLIYSPCLVPARVEIIDLLGRIVDQQQLYTTALNVRQLASGMYTLRIYSENNIVIVKRLLKM
ncbi:T9SS type A sorting domain-containing protein [Cytophagaceae bacterium DM2B3-1]|uniref:T9SS type A sorting domain-containing protein n=1 Tax=Xanthocytophaga flava TaxID=3048013 RepID=A0ABT7CQ23_9BACT|nr:T9SS type A sorting domain-containing protein [Xanthocytophaga flavus]MDJ1494769.1 T9SS type A sorting domain-containing protein [Xanthocytophaga flavus]